MHNNFFWKWWILSRNLLLARQTWKAIIKIYLPWSPLCECCIESLVCEMGFVLFVCNCTICVVFTLFFYTATSSQMIFQSIVYFGAENLHNYSWSECSELSHDLFWSRSRSFTLSFFFICLVFHFSDTKRIFVYFGMQMCNTPDWNVLFVFTLRRRELGLRLLEQSAIEWCRNVRFTPYLYKMIIQQSCTQFELPIPWKCLTWFKTCDTNSRGCWLCCCCCCWR